MKKERRKVQDWPFQERIFRNLFDAGMLIKGIDGVLEIIGGFLFFFVSQAFVSETIIALTQRELIEDPGDLIANFLRHASGHLSVNDKLFGSVYLAAHGLCKVFLVICLLRNKLWAYPVAIAFLMCFVGFQLYWMRQHFSWGLMVLTGMDIVVTMLIWHEYGFLKRRRDRVTEQLSID